MLTARHSAPRENGSSMPLRLTLRGPAGNPFPSDLPVALQSSLAGRPASDSLARGLAARGVDLALADIDAAATRDRVMVE